MQRSLIFLIQAIWLSMVLNTAVNASDVAVIFLHGNQSVNNGSSTPLINAFHAEGFQVITPEMPWSEKRAYDKGFEQALIEVRAKIDALREKDEDTIIFLGGFDLGANAAIAFAALQDYVDGVLAIEPGHTPDLKSFQDKLGDSLVRAKKMLNAGSGDKKAEFSVVSQGSVGSKEMSAATYLSYFDPDGNAVLPKNMSHLWEGVALLWVVGSDGEMAKHGRAYAYDLAPEYEFNRYVEIKGGNHTNTPEKATDEIISWMKGIIKSLQLYTGGIEETQVKPGVSMDGLGL